MKFHTSRGEVEYVVNCLGMNCPGHLVKREGLFGVFWGCSEYPRCHMTRQDRDVEEQISADVYGVVPDPDEPFYGM